MPIQPGLALPAQPATFAALQAMRSIILSECLVAGVTPFAALTAADAARYGAANAVFVGRPKDFNDAYLPQCCVWMSPNNEVRNRESRIAPKNSGRQELPEEIAEIIVGNAHTTYCRRTKCIV